MPRYKGAHLTWNDRLTIEKMLREGYSKPQIARYLGVHHSTVYDECRRGAVELKRSDLTTYISYSADVAKDYHLDRKKNMEKPLKIGKDHRLARWLVKTISEGYSPSAACSMLGKTPETTFSCTLCRQTVYKYIENGDLWPLTNKELRYKSDQKRTYNRVKAAKAPRGDSIEHRPEHINNREEPGHWEMDSVVGKKGTKAALCVLTGRVTRDEIIRKMHDDTAASVVGVWTGWSGAWGPLCSARCSRASPWTTGANLPIARAWSAPVCCPERSAPTSTTATPGHPESAAATRSRTSLSGGFSPRARTSAR
ncbi:MAG: IS30 family transposase [Dysosmobacter sp.]